METFVKRHTIVHKDKSRRNTINDEDLFVYYKVEGKEYLP